MTRPPTIRTFGIEPHELVIDNFAGGGGASTGIEAALERPVDIAINHSPEAIAMHTANHPETKHFCESIWEVDPREACGSRPVGLAWFSPDCTHFSKAKGGKPRSKEIRGLAWVVIRWAKAVAPRVIVLENVEEFQTWGPLGEDGKPIAARAGETFREWMAELAGLGYSVEIRTLVAADYGTPTTRKRLFLVARRDRRGIVWPSATHGRGRARPWTPASTIIDWALPCPSIFERRRPLAEATLRRIAAGVRRYVLDAGSPFIIRTDMQSGGRLRGVRPIEDPLRTITTAGGHALVTPFLASHYGASVGRAVTSPAPTVTAGGGGHTALVAPTLIQTGYGERPGQTPRALDLEKPLGTVVAGGAKHALVAALITKHYGGVVGHGTGRPLGAITTKDHHALTTAFLTKFYGTSTGADVQDPLPTVTAGGKRGGGHLAEVRAFLVRHFGEAPTEAQGEFFEARAASSERALRGIVTIGGEDYVIADIGMRMLQPHELFAAQGFPEDYVIAPEYNGRPLTKTAQIELAGNSVCPDVARAIIESNVRESAEAAA